jgi:hypothetical protein
VGGGGWVQLDPLGTSATNWPIVPAPGDYLDGEFGGMMIGKGNRSTWKKNLLQYHFVHHKSHMTWNPGRRGGKPATNGLIDNKIVIIMWQLFFFVWVQRLHETVKNNILTKKTELRGLSPQANYTDWTTAACRRT